MKLRLYEFLAFPAHVWLWVAARLSGGRFTCGPVDDDDDEGSNGASKLAR